MFQKAIKRDAKLRLALCGPAGSGKTYTSLELATELAQGGGIAYVDTEKGSASKYADRFNFDVVEPDEFDPRQLIETLREMARAGYVVGCIASLSHYWMGKGGELEIVDNTAARMKNPNSFAAWKTVTPIHNELVDAILRAPMHIIVSMRTKTEWVLDKDERTGKTTPRKIGTQPIMRDGIEFEFDVCGDLDQENKLTITKSRCPELSGKAINRPGKEMAQTLRKWLSGAPISTTQPPAGVSPSPATTAAVSAGGANGSTGAPAEEVPAEVQAIWSRMAGRKENIIHELQELHSDLADLVEFSASEEVYAELVNMHGQPLQSTKAAKAIARGLWERIQAEEIRKKELEVAHAE